MVLKTEDVYLNLEDILGCQVPPEDLVGHQCSVFLQHKLLAVVSRQDAEVEGRSVVGGVVIYDRKLEDAGADRLVFLGERCGNDVYCLSDSISLTAQTSWVESYLDDNREIVQGKDGSVVVDVREVDVDHGG